MDDIEGKTVHQAGARSAAKNAHSRAVASVHEKGTRSTLVHDVGSGTSQHVVHFYERDEFLVESVAGFASAGLDAGASCVIIATEPHRLQIAARLRDSGRDREAALARGTYVALDAAETLARFMVSGMPDPACFQEVVGNLVARAAEASPGHKHERVRIFGEMVALLWAAGNHDAAIRLEELWNDLAAGTRHPFMLFCAYPTRGFAGEGHGEALGAICARHTRVIPDESYTALTSPDERLLAITLLQQKAASLEAEIAERRQAELLLAEQNRLLESIAAGRPLEECLIALTGAVARLQPGTRASVLLADEARTKFPTLYAADIPPSFVAGLKDAPINDLAIGTCGTAVYSGQSIACDDIAHDERWSTMWRNLCVAHGILACHSEPVIGSDGLPLGSFMLCFDTSREPTEWEQRIAHFGTHVASIAIERDRAQAAVRTSEEQMAAVFHSTTVGVAVLAPDARFIKVNDAFCRIVGYTGAELTAALDCATLTHPDDLPAMNAKLDALLTGRVPAFVIEKRYRRKDGSTIWVRNSVSLARDALGQPLHLVALCEDITLRKQAEAAAAHLAAIVTSAEDAIASKTLEGVVTSWNASAERMFDYTAEEMIGQPITRLFPPDRLDEEDLILARIRAGERIEHFETVRITKDGRHIEVSLTISPIRDSNGTIVGASKIVRDITERKRMEEALRESEETFRTLADSMSQFAWMADPKGWIFWYNQRWYDYTGTTLDEMRGWGWTRVHHPDHVDRVVARIQQSWDTGELWEDTFPLRGKDGRYRWFLSRAVPIRDANGKIALWVGTNTDIDEQKQLEERKNAFISMASHELRTPVTSLTAFTQVLQRRLDGRTDADPQTVRFLGRMEAQLRKLTTLISDLLDVSKIQTGSLPYRKTEFELDELVRETVENVQAASTTHRLRVRGTTHARIYADRDRVGQVVVNLLTNATKYSPGANQVIVRLETDGEQAHIAVRDFGIGIAEEDHERIFERLYQVADEGRNTYPGLGIGLYIARTIVEQHGGRIWLESRPGAGSAFHVSLPLSRDAHTDADACMLSGDAEER